MFKNGATVWFIDNDLKLRYGTIINISNDKNSYDIKVRGVGPKNIIVSEIFENIKTSLIFRNELDAIGLQTQLINKYNDTFRRN